MTSADTSTFKEGGTEQMSNNLSYFAAIAVNLAIFLMFAAIAKPIVKEGSGDDEKETSRMYKLILLGLHGLLLAIFSIFPLTQIGYKEIKKIDGTDAELKQTLEKILTDNPSSNKTLKEAVESLFDTKDSNFVDFAKIKKTGTHQFQAGYTVEDVNALIHNKKLSLSTSYTLMVAFLAIAAFTFYLLMTNKEKVKSVSSAYKDKVRSAYNSASSAISSVRDKWNAYQESRRQKKLAAMNAKKGPTVSTD